MLSLTEQQFYQDVQMCIDQLNHDAPTTATLLGDHRFDHRLGDFSPKAIQDQHKRIGEWLARFESYDRDFAKKDGLQGWTLDSEIDRILMVQLTKNFLRNFEKLHMLQ